MDKDTFEKMKKAGIITSRNQLKNFADNTDNDILEQAYLVLVDLIDEAVAMATPRYYMMVDSVELPYVYEEPLYDDNPEAGIQAILKGLRLEEDDFIKIDGFGRFIDKAGGLNICPGVSVHEGTVEFSEFTAYGEALEVSETDYNTMQGYIDLASEISLQIAGEEDKLTCIENALEDADEAASPLYCEDMKAQKAERLEIIKALKERRALITQAQKNLIQLVQAKYGY